MAETSGLDQTQRSRLQESLVAQLSERGVDNVLVTATVATFLWSSGVPLVVVQLLRKLPLSEFCAAWLSGEIRVYQAIGVPVIRVAAIAYLKGEDGSPMGRADRSRQIVHLDASDVTLRLEGTTPFPCQ